MEPERITREEIEKAQTLYLEFAGAKERMVKALVELGQKFCLNSDSALALWTDWVQFFQVVQFMLEKDALLEKQLEGAREMMRKHAGQFAFADISENALESKLSPPEGSCSRIN